MKNGVWNSFSGVWPKVRPINKQLDSIILIATDHIKIVKGLDPGLCMKCIDDAVCCRQRVCSPVQLKFVEIQPIVDENDQFPSQMY